MIYADNKRQIFTYDKETERKTGALTMLVFSFCLLFSPVIFAGIVGIGVSLGSSLLSDVIPIADGAVIQQMTIIFCIAMIVVCVALPFVFTYVISAIWQMLCCYVRLEDGKFIKLQWRNRPSHWAKAAVIARTAAEHIPAADSANVYRTVRNVYSLLEGIGMVQDPALIAGYLDGSAEIGHITCFPLSNIVILKKTKTKLVIMADTLVKNKPKRKKLKIYWMYHDMDALYQLCEGGCPIVND